MDSLGTLDWSVVWLHPCKIHPLITMGLNPSWFPQYPGDHNGGQSCVFLDDLWLAAASITQEVPANAACCRPIIGGHYKIIPDYLGLPWRAINGINSWRPRPNAWHFANGIFKWIFLNEISLTMIKVPLKFVSDGPINDEKIRFR